MFAGRLLSCAVASLLVASLTAPVAHASLSNCLNDGTHSPNHTFVVKVRVLDDKYQLGEKAKFRVRVHRVVEGQDLGPVEGAEVGVGVTLGDVYLTGGGMTDAEGRTLVKVALKKYAPAGLADAFVYASKLVTDVPCHLEYEYEYGEVRKLGLFKVVR